MRAACGRSSTRKSAAQVATAHFADRAHANAQSRWAADRTHACASAADRVQSSARKCTVQMQSELGIRRGPAVRARGFQPASGCGEIPFPGTASSEVDRIVACNLTRLSWSNSWTDSVDDSTERGVPARLFSGVAGNSHDSKPWIASSVKNNNSSASPCPAELSSAWLCAPNPSSESTKERTKPATHSGCSSLGLGDEPPGGEQCPSVCNLKWR